MDLVWLSAPFGDSLSIIYRLERQFKRDYDREESLIGKEHDRRKRAKTKADFRTEN